MHSNLRKTFSFFIILLFLGSSLFLLTNNVSAGLVFSSGCETTVGWSEDGAATFNISTQKYEGTYSLSLNTAGAAAYGVITQSLGSTISGDWNATVYFRMHVAPSAANTVCVMSGMSGATERFDINVNESGYVCWKGSDAKWHAFSATTVSVDTWHKFDLNGSTSINRIYVKLDGATLGTYGTYKALGTYDTFRFGMFNSETNKNYYWDAIKVYTGSPTSPPVITSYPLINWHTNDTYHYQVTATNSPTSWSIFTNATGLSVGAGTGLIQGVVNTPGIYYVDVVATNAGGNGNQNYSLRIQYSPDYSFSGIIGLVDDGSPVGSCVDVGDRIYWAYGAYGDGATYLSAWIIEYNKNTRKWTNNTLVEPTLGGDYHGVPKLVVNDTGIIYYFYDDHNTPIKFKKSLLPLDITAWSSESTISAGVDTYHTPFILSNGTIVLFFRERTGGGGYNWAFNMMFSKDGGVTWSSPVAVIDSPLVSAIGWTPYPRFYQNRDSFDCAFKLYNQSSASDLFGLYYFRYNFSLGTCYNASGVSLGPTCNRVADFTKCLMPDLVAGTKNECGDIINVDGIPHIISKANCSGNQQLLEHYYSSGWKLKYVYNYTGGSLCWSGALWYKSSDSSYIYYNGFGLYMGVTNPNVEIDKLTRTSSGTWTMTGQVIGDASVSNNQHAMGHIGKVLNRTGVSTGEMITIMDEYPTLSGYDYNEVCNLRLFYGNGGKFILNNTMLPVYLFSGHLKPTIISSPILSGFNGVTYRQLIISVGSPTIIYYLTGNVTAWASITLDGWIIGTPTTLGTYTVEVRAHNSYGNGYLNYTLTILPNNYGNSGMTNNQYNYMIFIAAIFGFILSIMILVRRK